VTEYTPQHLPGVVESVSYKPGWDFRLVRHVAEDGSGGLQLQIDAWTDDSFDFTKKRAVRHLHLVPMASYNRDEWVAWVFDRVRDIETHEAGEFFRVDGVREFAPHHSNGENPYRVWHVSDWATADKSSGQD
jgi:hypothetical protein